VLRRIHLLVLCCLFALPAWANGRYPAASQLARNPQNPAHMVAQTTYGFLQTFDGGATWQWICEVSVGYDGQEDPFIGIFGNGTILAATTQGLSLSQDHACGWRKIPVPEYLGRLPAIDLVVDSHDTAHAIVLDVAEDQLHTQLVTTHDSGATWTQLGPPLPNNAAGLTLEIAPSQGSRLYVSARVGTDQDQHALLRSDDGGLSWATLPFNPTMTDAQGVPLPADQTQVLGTYIGAVDPTHPDTLWLRVHRSFNPDQVWRTQDGGQTWQLAFQAVKGRLPAFALSPDGQQVTVGAVSPQPGIWRAQTSDLQFAPVSGLTTYCLKWLDNGLYACTDEVIDGMTIGLSTDNGAHFETVHHRQDLMQLDCAETTRTAVLCGKLWPLVSYQLGVGEQTATPPAKTGCQAAQVGSFVGTLAALLGLFATVRRRRR
jgi:photosystem II stability/assembly factor-like uncharacterized protein